MVSLWLSHAGEEVGLQRSTVTWEQEERDALAAIPRQGSPPAQKVLHTLILLNCDEGEGNAHRVRGEALAETLRSSARKVDRVQRRCVEEGLEAALGGRQGRRPSYERQADGACEARLVALRRAAVGPLAGVAPVASGSGRGARLQHQRGARDGAAGSQKNTLKP